MNKSQMPWGAYRGYWINKDIPIKYLQWLVKADCFNILPISTQYTVKERLKQLEQNENSHA